MSLTFRLSRASSRNLPHQTLFQCVFPCHERSTKKKEVYKNIAAFLVVVDVVCFPNPVCRAWALFKIIILRNSGIFKFNYSCPWVRRTRTSSRRISAAPWRPNRPARGSIPGRGRTCHSAWHRSNINSQTSSVRSGPSTWRGEETKHPKFDRSPRTASASCDGSRALRDDPFSMSTMSTGSRKIPSPFLAGPSCSRALFWIKISSHLSSKTEDWEREECCSGMSNPGVGRRCVYGWTRCRLLE